MAATPYEAEIWSAADTARLAYLVDADGWFEDVWQGSHRVSIKVPASPEILDAIGDPVRQVIRIYDRRDESYVSYRMETHDVSRAKDGKRVVEMGGLFIGLSDLGDNLVAAEKTLAGLDLATAIDELLAGSGWTRGTVDSITGVELRIAYTSSLALLGQVVSATETEYRLNYPAKTVDVSATLGSTLDTQIRWRRNMNSFRKVEDFRTYANRVFLVGRGSPALTRADARFTVDTVPDSTTIRFSPRAFLSDGSHANACSTLVKTGSGTDRLITTTSAEVAAGIDEAVTTAAHGMSPGDTFALGDASGDPLAFLETQAGIDSYGRRGTRENTDLEEFDNLAPNADLSAWSGGNPDDWSEIGSAVASENTDRTKIEQGLRSARVVCTNDGDGIEATITGLDSTPSGGEDQYSIAFRINVETADGSIQAFAEYQDAALSIWPPTGQQFGTTGTGWLTYSIEGTIKTASSVKLRVAQDGATATTFVLDHVILVKKPTLPSGFTTGRNSDLAHARLWTLLQDRSAVRVTYRIDALDLYELDAERFPFDAFAAGDSLAVFDEDLGVDVSVAVAKKRVPLLRPYQSTIDFGDRMRSVSDAITSLVEDAADAVDAIGHAAGAAKGLQDGRPAIQAFKALTDAGYFRIGFEVDGGNLKADSVETGAIAISSGERAISVSALKMTPNKGASPNLYSTVEADGLDSTKAYVAFLDDPTNPWTFYPADRTSLATGKTYFVYIRVLQDTKDSGSNVLAFNDGPRASLDDGTYYWFPIGVYDTRESAATKIGLLALTWGFTTITGDTVVTGKIVSDDGKTWFDLTNSEVVLDPGGTSTRVYLGADVLDKGPPDTGKANVILGAWRAQTNPTVPTGEGLLVVHDDDDASILDEVGLRRIRPDHPHWPFYTPNMIYSGWVESGRNLIAGNLEIPVDRMIGWIFQPQNSEHRTGLFANGEWRIRTHADAAPDTDQALFRNVFGLYERQDAPSSAWNAIPPGDPARLHTGPLCAGNGVYGGSGKYEDLRLWAVQQYFDGGDLRWESQYRYDGIVFLFEIPIKTVLTASLGTSTAHASVAHTINYPAGGEFKVGSDHVAYDEKTATSLRNVVGVTQTHPVGTPVYFNDTFTN